MIRIPAYTQYFLFQIPTVVRSVLKIRYLLLGGALGGGASLAKQYEDWKKNLPDTDWIKDLIPGVNILLKIENYCKIKKRKIFLKFPLFKTNFC